MGRLIGRGRRAARAKAPVVLAAVLATGGCAVAPVRAPEPARETVVLVHGLWRGQSAMWLLGRRLEEAGFDVVRLDYSSFSSSAEEIVMQVADQIDACCSDLAGPVHFVGHSMGGLAIRAYLVDSRVRNRGRVVLIGSPNSGTPIVDDYADTWWMGLAGPAARQLGTDADSFPNSLPEPDYPVGVIAGSRVSAIGLDLIPGDDDGLVPVESTRLPDMTDFVVVNTGHAGMRYSDEVAEQTIAFLRDGHFAHD